MTVYCDTIFEAIMTLTDEPNKIIYKRLNWTAQRFYGYFNEGRSLNPEYYHDVRLAIRASPRRFYRVIASFYN